MKRLLLTATAVIATLAASPVVTPTQAAAQAGLTCEVRTAKRGSATVVEGFVSAPAGFAGSYRISVVGGGGDTDQSGEFSGSSGKSTLGAVPVAGAGAYRAEIVIKQNGEVRCTNATTGKI